VDSSPDLPTSPSPPPAPPPTVRRRRVLPAACAMGTCHSQVRRRECVNGSSLITLGSDTNCWNRPSALLPINRRRRTPARRSRSNKIGELVCAANDLAAFSVFSPFYYAQPKGNMPTNGDRDHVQRLKCGHDSVAMRKAHDAPWRARRPQPGAPAHVHAQLPWEIRKLNMHLSIERVRLKLTMVSVFALFLSGSGYQ
jgi:hypothetical protein